MTHPPALFASFALPAVALGTAAAAAAVPVLIHLLSRQRYQVVPWAAVRFLIAAQKQRRRRVDRWVLLAARVLAVLLPLAAMAAATPWAERAWQAVSPGPQEAVSNAPRTHRILVVDGSLSMSARAGDRSRYDAAVAQAERAIRAANPGDGFTLIYLAGPAQAVVPGPSTDADKVVEELHALKPTHGTADLAAGLTAVADVLTRSPRTYPRRQVLLFTDLQRSAWGGLLPKDDGTVPEVWQRVLPRAEVAVVDAGRGDADNLAVTDLALADPLPLVDAPAAVTATVQNFGRADRAAVRVELQLGRPSAGGPEGTLFAAGEHTIAALPAGQRATVTFALEGATQFREPGVHLLRIRIADADDPLPADDTRALAVEVREGLSAVLVNGKPAAGGTLKGGAEYLSEALAPGGKQVPGNPARPKIVTLGQFSDPQLGDLSAADCVFLCDVPRLSPGEVARLEAHLKRGGGLVVGLGPTAAANLEFYNRVLFDDGNGLLPGRLLGVNAVGPDDPGFRLAGDDEAFRRPPLAAFRDDNARAGLTTVPFRGYVKMDAPPDGKARRVLSFVPADPKLAPKDGRPDPAVVEWPRHRGRVVVFTSSFNADWSDWPVLPSYLPFAHESLRFAAANPDRHTLRVGDALEDILPVNAVGLTARVDGPDGIAVDVPVVAGDEAGVVRFGGAVRAGVYRVRVGGLRDHTFAANVPESTPGGGSESDLRRLDPTELEKVGPVPVVADPTDAELAAGDGGLVSFAPRPHGPTIARWLLTLAVLVLVGETALAWGLGPARAAVPGAARGREEPAPFRVPLVLTGLLLVFVTLAVLGVVVHAERTGTFLGFLPDRNQRAVEEAFGVPEAGPGENNRLRLESSPAYLSTHARDRLARLGLLAASVLAVGTFYLLERRAAGGLGRVVTPFLLRTSALALVTMVFLPQCRVAFDREGWPDVAVLLDTSASMATVDDLQDPAVRAKAEQLARTAGASEADRLLLAKTILARPDGDLLTRLLTERKVRVHVYTIAEQEQLLTTLDDADGVPDAGPAVQKLTADGNASRLGDCVQAVLKAFRGGSLSGIVAFTDGVTTAGDDLPKAGREAGRAGVPLYLIGVGDAREPPDLVLSDLKADDVVLKGDELVFEARVTARGPNPPESVTVTLYERQGEKLVKKDEAPLHPDPSGKPVPLRLKTVPTEPGEKTFVIDLPVQPQEAEPGNNRLERVVLVTESKKLKVLYVEGYPRYEFRFVKALLERESDAVVGNKSVDLRTLLLDASDGYVDQDKSALKELPTRAELFEYDVVILGDVDPAALPRANQAFADIAEFVKARGGGLLFVAGPQASPHKLFATPLADLLPVVAADGAPRDGNPSRGETAPDGFRPRVTPFGQTHPLLRLAPDEADNARAWAALKPMVWSSSGYKRKQSAEVLAVHPDRPADGFPGENHPLVLQQFVGAGRVVFFGFDETWRWRFRDGEPTFNQFWGQSARVLSRNRVNRVELKTDKQTAYRRDEPIRLTARFPDDAPAPAADVPVKVTVERGPLRGPDGKPVAGGTEVQTVQLAKVESTRATYQTLLTRTPEGEYRFYLTEPAVPGTRPRAEAKVLPPPGERERLEMNRADLMRAAAESRGKFYTLAEADDVVKDLPDVARVTLNQPVPPTPLWNNLPVYLLFLLTLATEWVLRRQERLL